MHAKETDRRHYAKLSNGGPLMTPGFWLAVSQVGSPVAMIALCVVLVLTLVRLGFVRAATAYVLIAGIGGLLNTWLKDLVHRPRPPGAERYLNGHSWSFPSGHAMGSLIGYGLLAYCALTYMPLTARVRRWVSAICATVVLAVGASRVALGVHYRGDVLGGWIIGTLWLLTGIAILRRVESRTHNSDGTTVTRG